MFTIHYILGKKTCKADALTRKINYIKIEQKFSYNILKNNKNRLLLVNKYELCVLICIIRDDQKQFFIEKKGFCIPKNQKDKIIK